MRMGRGAPPQLSAGEVAETEPLMSGGRVLRGSPYLLGIALLVTLTSSAEGVSTTCSRPERVQLRPAERSCLILCGLLHSHGAHRDFHSGHRAAALAGKTRRRPQRIAPAGWRESRRSGAAGARVLAIALARGAEVVLRSSVFRGAYELLFTPVAPLEKRATKLLLDVGAARVGDILVPD